MAAAGHVRRVIRAITKYRAMRSAMKDALARGAVLLDMEAVWVRSDAFMAEIADMPEAESRAVIDYIGQDDATQRQTWASLHSAMAGRHGGPPVSRRNRR